MEPRTHRFYAIFSFADDGITVTFPDLPGCISCGYSRDEAKKMAKEALELFLEDMEEEDLPISNEINQSVLQPFEELHVIEVQI